MPNYEEMYYTLFNKITDITEELKALQSKMCVLITKTKINNKNLLHEKKYF